jgi:hypothetical protein
VRVRIEISQSGGIGYFPGLQKPTLIDAERLDAGQRDALRKLVDAAHFFDLPDTVGVPAKGAADYQHHVLTIDDGGHRHTVKILVPCEDAAVRDLVQAVQAHAKAARGA